MKKPEVSRNWIFGAAVGMCAFVFGWMESRRRRTRVREWKAA